MRYLILSLKNDINSHGNCYKTSVSVSVSFINSNQRDVGAWGTMHELAIT